MNFSEEWEKLKNLKVGTIITSIRWNDYPQEVGDHIPIKLKGTEVAKAIVVGIQETELGAIPWQLIRFDTYKGITVDSFYNLMEKFYSRKEDWKSTISEVKIYFLLITKETPK